jgi:ABC-2 type transport system permease protein
LNTSNEIILDKNPLKIIKTSFLTAIIVWKSYKGTLIMFILLSILFAMLPIFMGRALGGENYKEFFNANGGGTHPEAFLILGTNAWTLVLYALWDYATYMREEQQQGTLESLFLTPANQGLIIVGRGLLSAIMAVSTFLIGVFIGLLIFDPSLISSIDFPLFLLAVLLILLGFIPLLGLSMLLGALIIRFKEVNNILSVLQFLLGSLMGVFFPLTVLPAVVQIISALFPGTWIVQDIRYVIAGSPPMLVIFGLDSIFGNIPIIFDFFALIVLAVFWTFAGIVIFSRTLKRMEKEEGISQY